MNIPCVHTLCMVCARTLCVRVLPSLEFDVYRYDGGGGVEGRATPATAADGTVVHVGGDGKVCV